MGQTIERMKEGYSKIRNEALAHAFAYMNLIEHWGSGIPRIIDKVKAAGLREPEFIGGEVDLRINIYRGQVDSTGGLNDAIKVLDIIDKIPDNGNGVPDKTEIVPDTMKKCRIVAMQCQIRQEKCRIVNRNNKFINMYWKRALLLLLKQ